MTVWLALLTGGVGAAVVKVVGDLIQKIIDRKNKKDDSAQADIERKKCEDAELLHATADGVKWMLYDRIKYLGTRYIDDASVDFNDRRLLHEMHKVYHYGLHGNGDLDLIMDAVNALPTKT